MPISVGEKNLEALVELSQVLGGKNQYWETFWYYLEEDPYLLAAFMKMVNFGRRNKNIMFVDYTLSVDQMISIFGFKDAYVGINSFNFPINKRVPIQMAILRYHITRMPEKIWTAEILENMKSRKRRPFNVTELLTFGRRKRESRYNKVVALGAMSRVGGKVLILERSDKYAPWLPLLHDADYKWEVGEWGFLEIGEYE